MDNRFNRETDMYMTDVLRLKMWELCNWAHDLLFASYNIELLRVCGSCQVSLHLK